MTEDSVQLKEKVRSSCFLPADHKALNSVDDHCLLTRRRDLLSAARRNKHVHPFYLDSPDDWLHLLICAVLSFW